MSASHWSEEWEYVADLVVVGSGAAGASAALIAASRGASVIVLEKANFTGGTTGKSGGVMWVPNNPVMKAQGIADPRPEAIAYMARSAYPTAYNPASPTLGLTQFQYDLIATFYDRGCEALDALVAAGGLVLESVPYPDYYSELPEDTVDIGRCVQPEFPKGWRRGIDPTGGQMLTDGLLAAAERHGVKVLIEHEVAHLVRNDDGTVIGLEVRTGKRALLVGARQGVIFASGGFLHNPELTQEYLRGPVLGGAARDTATGDFVRIGIEAGARLGNMNNAWWDQVIVELALRNRATSGDLYSPAGDSMLMVNKYGKRAVDEKIPYNERGQIHHMWDPAKWEYPNFLMFMIFDDDVMHAPSARFRWPIPEEGEPLPFYIMSAPDIPSLTKVIAERVASIADRTGGVQLDADFGINLEATIETFNDYAAAGRDADFGRGEKRIEQVWAGTPRGDNPLAAMHPLRKTGPYYAMIVGPGALDTKGGPVADAQGRVIGVDGEPIPGLFGAGNCVASAAGQAYWGPGGTIGPAVVFGYLAALSAMERPRID